MDFEAAFHDHNAPLFRYVNRLLGDADVAADVVQESFVRLLRHPMPDADVRRWLFTVATNLVRDHARMETRRQRLLVERYTRPSAEPGPDEAASRSERVAAVRRALDQLAPRDRQMLLMRQEGFRYGEIAEAVGVAPGSVGTLLVRALRRFSVALGVTPADAHEVALARNAGRAGPEAEEPGADAIQVGPDGDEDSDSEANVSRE